jgi:predicted metalloprotease with PDZ domain
MEPTRYHVAIHDAHAHLYEVVSTFAGPFAGDALDVFMPAWTPGSYLLREFARNVVAISAEDDRGRPLSIAKTDKATWRVEVAGAARVTVRTRVYANDLTVRTSHLDGTHAYFNGANLFPLSSASRTEPCVLTLDVPEGWRVATTLPADAAEKGAYRAEDYDHLADCPVEMGTHETVRFEVDRVPHEVAIWGAGNYDAAVLRADLEKIVRAQAAIMGGLPFSRYLFLIHLTDKGRGGLEHRDSTTLLCPRFGFRPRKEYEEFLRLASHEYFHAWNVKRIKPKAFDPYDYRNENYTKLLWAMEGFTSYYELVALARAGLLSRERLLAILGEEITALLRNPGRLVQSVAESSFDAWIKYYRQDENSVNAGVSYYRKGSLIAWILDLELRARTRNAKSLDDLMRTMLERHGAKGRGLPEDAYAKVLAEIAGPAVAGGAPIEALLAQLVDGTGEIDFAAHLAHAGLAYKTRPADSADDKGGSAGKRAKKKDSDLDDVPIAPWFGFDTRMERGHTTVSAVLAGSPAATGGLYVGDELVAFAGWRADDKAWRARAAERVPGDHVKLTVIRRDKLQEVTLVAAPPPVDTAWIEVATDATPPAKALLDAWAAGAT